MIDWVYGKIANWRTALYEKEIFSTYSLGAKTISVGNITVGGTGKTPLVALVAEILADKGEKVCILSRGYGRDNPKNRVLVSDGEKILTDAKTAGDEPFELAHNLLGKAFVISDANRVAAADWARKKFGITAFVLDDGFQHQKARRDLDIVLLDATNPFGNGKVLPLGTLREPLKNLRRADVIVITRSNLVNQSQIAELKTRIVADNSQCPILTAHSKVFRLRNLDEFQKTSASADIEQIKSQKSIAFCALGNPNNFFEQLRRENFNLAGTRKFPDHHFYTAADIAKLNAEVEQTNAEILLTTAKDAVKLKNSAFSIPCYVIESRVFFDDERVFIELIENLK